MSNSKPKRNFWLGNAILAVALLFLLKMDVISAAIGFNAMLIWIGLVAAGAWLVMKDQNNNPADPD